MPRFNVRWRRALGMGALALVIVADGVLCAAPPKRARRPTFPKQVQDVFFPDALKTLVGPRPEKAAPGSTPVAAPSTPADHPAVPASSGDATSWAKLISSEAIEDEIKTQQRKLGEAVANAARFKGGDYQSARVNLSVLAAMFAIDAQYGQPMRWQREAGGVRDLLARAGLDCKSGTDAAYQQAKARSDELATLVRGGTLDLPADVKAAPWNQVADRSQLMKRLEQAHEQGLAPWTSSADEFAKHREQALHEAQLIAALATVIQREGYEYADDDTFREHADALRTGALVVQSAVRKDDYAGARQAVGEIGKACANCHEGYRN